MKVYQVRTDGESRLVLADSFGKAIECDFKIFMEENEGEDYATREYYETLLEEVVCIGGLGG